MKKIAGSILVMVLVMGLFSGCKQEIAETLTVYMVESEALYVSSMKSFSKTYPDIELNLVTFDSYEAMEQQLSSELMSGEGPDVLLFNSLYSTTDPYKMAAGGSLLSLDEQRNELSADQYYGVILDAGKMNGHQYFIPLTWNILQAYSTKETIIEKGYSDDLYSVVPAEIEALVNDDTQAVSSLQLLRADAMNCFMEASGTDLVDFDSGTVVEQEAFRKTADFVKDFYSCFDKIGSIANKYSNDFKGAVSHFTYLVENYPFMNNLRYYQSLYPETMEQEMYFEPFTNLKGDGISAQIMQYGAINGNTKHAEKAWELLKYILDTSGPMDFSKYETHTIYYAPVHIANYEAAVNELTSTTGKGPVQLEALNEENGKILADMPSRITRGVIRNAPFGELVQECMEPYLLDRADFDECYDALIHRVELYLDE